MKIIKLSSTKLCFQIKRYNLHKHQDLYPFHYPHYPFYYPFNYPFNYPYTYPCHKKYVKFRYA